MPLSLEFNVSHRYAAADGIDVPIELHFGNRKVELLARLDTGAAYCIFERKYAEALRLDVESGLVRRFITMAGSFVANEHEVPLHTLGVEFSAVVYFAHDWAFSKSFVGRTGWLDRLRVGIIDYDRLLFLSLYDS
ncbi:MAG: hypothetical protein HY820_16065 [Acidobacteria bacterium]|nr:hypothetical protein [Acidobacteriota bacterium]